MQREREREREYDVTLNNNVALINTPQVQNILITHKLNKTGTILINRFSFKSKITRCKSASQQESTVF